MTKFIKLFVLALFLSFVGFATACGGEEMREVEEVPNWQPLPEVDRTAPEITLEVPSEFVETDRVTVLITFNGGVYKATITIVYADSSPYANSAVVFEKEASLGVDGEESQSHAVVDWTVTELTPDTKYEIVVSASDKVGNRRIAMAGFRTKALLAPVLPIVQPEVSLSYHSLTSQGMTAKLVVSNAPEYGVCQLQADWGSGFVDVNTAFVCGDGEYNRPSYYFGVGTYPMRVVYRYGNLKVVSNVITFTTAPNEMDLVVLSTGVGEISLQWQAAKRYNRVYTSCSTWSDSVSNDDVNPLEQVGDVQFTGLESGKDYYCRSLGTWYVGSLWVVESSPAFYVRVP